jgi:hypothetical protein
METVSSVVGVGGSPGMSRLGRTLTLIAPVDDIRRDCLEGVDSRMFVVDMEAEAAWLGETDIVRETWAKEANVEYLIQET